MNTVPGSTSAPSRTADNAANFPAPEVPGYSLVRMIGAGGYGEVWLGHNDALGWKAVKIVSRTTFASDHDYEREFEGIRKYAPVSRKEPILLHILQCDRNNADGYYYYVMELADDCSGREIIDPPAYIAHTLKVEMQRRGRLPQLECLNIGLHLAAALRSLHEQRLAHRDVKPSNVIFVRSEARLADVGLVTAIDRTVSCDLGTQGYVPPEGGGTPQADLYALGKVLYELVTGQDRMSFPKLPNLRGLPTVERKGILELNRVFLKACATRPADRYPKAEALIADLEYLKQGASLTLRHRIKLALFTVLGISLALVAAALVWGFWILSREHERELVHQQELFLRNAQSISLGIHENGWSDRVWANSVAASKLHLDAEIRRQAAASLAGLDARPLHIFTNLPVTSAAFATDGTLLVGGFTNSHLQLIDPSGRREELPTRGDGPVGWSSDGTPLQLIPRTNCCVLRDARNGNALRMLPLSEGEGVVSYEEEEGPVLCMTPDGSRIATCLTNSAKSRIAVWDGRTGSLLAEAPQEARSMAFSPDGAWLACGNTDRGIEVRSIPGFKNSVSLDARMQREPISALAFGRDPVMHKSYAAPGERWFVAAGDRGGGIVVWDLASRQPFARLRGSPFSVLSLAFHPDRLTLASAGRTETRIWDLPTERLLLRIAAQGGDAASALAFSTDGSRLAWGTQAGFNYGSIGVWQLVPHRGVRVMRGLDATVRQTWFSPDNRLLAALSDNWQVGIWDMSGRLARLIDVPQGMYADNAGGAFDQKAERFAFATWKEARLYDLRNGAVIRTWELPPGLADSIQFDDLGRILLSRREAWPNESKFRRWRLRELLADGTSSILHQQSETNWLSFFTLIPAGGRCLLVVNTGPDGVVRRVKVFDTGTGQELWEHVTTMTNGNLRMNLEATGHWVTCYYNSNLDLLDLETGKVSRSKTEAVIHQDGKRFARALSDGITGVQVFDRDGKAGGLYFGSGWHFSDTLKFSPDGRFLACGTEQEGAVLLAELAEVQKRLKTLENR